MIEMLPPNFDPSQVYTRTRFKPAPEALEERGWFSPRPGVWYCYAGYLHMHFWQCQDCKEPMNETFHIDNDLWKETYPEDGVACKACFDLRVQKDLK